MEGSTHSNHYSYHMDIFTRNSTIFGVVVIFFIAFKFLIQNYKVFIIIIGYSWLYYVIEHRIVKVTRSIIGGDSYIRDLPSALLWWSALAFVLCGTIIPCARYFAPDGYLGAYMRAFGHSAAIFLASSALRALFLGCGLVPRFVLRAGVLSVLQHAVIIVRDCCTFAVWASFHSTRVRYRSFCLAAYCAMKLFIFGYSVFELLDTFRIYKANRQKKFRISASRLRKKCPICMSKMIAEPVFLPCGHIFCYHCIIRWLHHKVRCPMCSNEPPEPPTVLELCDSYISFPIFISAL